MTIVSVASDLHLEFSDIKLPGVDILLLCGDTLVASRLAENKSDADSRAERKRYRRFCAKELTKYQRVLAICGNHEFYHSGVIEEEPELIRDLFREFAPNTSLLENEYVEIDGVRFVGSTLWATYGYGTADHMTIQDGINDFATIRTTRPHDALTMWKGSRAFLVEDAYQLHQEALTFLKQAVKTDMPCVVFTHHAPTYLACNRKRFPDGSMDDAYASNQSEFILGSPNIKCFFHGHSHYRYRTTIGETKVASNPRGYYGRERSALGFNPCELDFLLEDFTYLDRDG